MDESVYQYRYETHCHTSWCSGCGQDSPQDMAAAYYHMGYAGIVITDHFLRGNSCVDRNLPWADQMGRYFQACQAAAQWAKGKDFDVLFGIEHCYGNGKEVLTYGITLEFLVANPDIHLLPIHQYADLVHQAGGFLSLAHPYRQRSYITPGLPPQPQHMDALEVFNYYNYPEATQKAAARARETGLPGTSGGDEHSCKGEAIGKAGVAFRERARTGQELVQALRSRDYGIYVNGVLKSCMQ